MAESAAFRDSEGVPLHPIRMTRRITPLRDLLALWRVWRTVRRIRPQIVHAHTPKGGLLGMIAAWIERTPVRAWIAANDSATTQPGISISDATVTEGNTGKTAVSLTVSLTAPIEGASGVAPAAFTLTAQAADDEGSVVKVQFFAGSTLLFCSHAGMKMPEGPLHDLASVYMKRGFELPEIFASEAAKLQATVVDPQPPIVGTTWMIRARLPRPMPWATRSMAPA